MGLFVANDSQRSDVDCGDEAMTMDGFRAPLQTPPDDRSSRFPPLSLDN
jgi:hypothetical protein